MSCLLQMITHTHTHTKETCNLTISVEVRRREIVLRGKMHAHREANKKKNKGMLLFPGWVCVQYYPRVNRLGSQDCPYIFRCYFGLLGIAERLRKRVCFK